MAQRKTTSASNSSQPIPTTPHRMRNQRTIVIGFIALCLLALAVFAIRTNSRAALPALANAYRANGTIDAAAYGRLPKISIDYGVLEKDANAPRTR